VSESELDPAVHDYLDGRLSEPERRRFEARLERDPELARVVEAYRAAGRTLREEPIELPPGFHARARARFETARTVPAGWRRFVSWEATGLAVAALLLAALVFPQIWERYRPASEQALSGAPPAERQEGTTETEPAAPMGAVEVPAPESEGRGKREAAVEPAEREPGAEESVAPYGDSVVTELEKAAPPRAPSPPPAREKDDSAKEAPAPPRRRDSGVHERRAQRLEQPAAEPYDEPDRARSGAEFEESADAFAPAPGVGMKLATPPRAESLPAGVVGTGELELIEDGETWKRFLERLPPGMSLGIRPDFSADRVAVVGPSPDVGDCAAVRVEGIHDRIVLVWPVGAPREASAEGGCVVVLPADGRPVEVSRR
jgi:hypothetical protein